MNFGAKSIGSDDPLRGLGTWVDLPRITDGRGDLTFLEGGNHIPFDIVRVYYLYNVPKDQMRAGHAHYMLRQFVIASSGNFDLVLDDGIKRLTVHMDRPDRGLLMGSMIWRELHNFSPDAVCLVMASMRFDEADYIRDYSTFLETVRSRRVDTLPRHAHGSGRGTSGP
jgi:hypothetical protein